MKGTFLVLVLAIGSAPLALVPFGTAEDGCRTPVEGMAVCQDDKDPRPDRVGIDVRTGNLSLNASYEEEHAEGGTERSVGARPQTAEGGTNASATCRQASLPKPCRDATANVGAQVAGTAEAAAQAGCEGLGEGEVPACTVASAAALARYEETGVQAAAVCGSTGFTDPKPCPQAVQAQVLLFTMLGEGGASLEVTPAEPGVSVCQHDPVTGARCAP